MYFADERKDFRAGTLGAARFREPGRAFRDDGLNVVPGFNVIDVGRLSVETFLGGERRTWTRASGVPFQRSNQRSLFSANKRSGTLHNFDIELEAAAKNVFAKHAVLAGLFDGSIQVVNSQRVFRANIDDSFSRAHHVSADDHALEQRVRIALDFVAIHVRAGIAFIGIADDVFLVGLGFGEKFPFIASQVASTAAAAQLCGFDLLDDVFRPTIDQHFIKGLVAANSNVFFDVVWIDEPAIAQDDFLLTLEERHIIPRRHFWIAAAIFNVGR